MATRSFFGGSSAARSRNQRVGGSCSSAECPRFQVTSRISLGVRKIKSWCRESDFTTDHLKRLSRWIYFLSSQIQRSKLNCNRGAAGRGCGQYAWMDDGVPFPQRSARTMLVNATFTKVCRVQGLEPTSRGFSKAPFGYRVQKSRHLMRHCLVYLFCLSRYRKQWLASLFHASIMQFFCKAITFVR